ncbi:MAG: hypothetical protein AB7I38_11700 [Dehalococcoidia bacterium]
MTVAAAVPDPEPTADDPATWLVGVGMNVGNNRWHAADSVRPPAVGGWLLRYSACGAPVRVAAKYGPYMAANLPGPVCAACMWWAAVRSGTVTDAIIRLPDLVRPLAERIVACADDDGYEVDHPRTVQLLAAITAHASAPLVDVDCAERGCEHGDDECPITGWGCDACSLVAGGWAGEWEGTYLPESVVEAPCSVLTTLARHYDVPIEPPGVRRG